MLYKFLKICLLIVLGATTIVGCQNWRNSGYQALPQNSATGLRIATYNVHYINMTQDIGPWSQADWERRKAPLDQAFKAMNADVIAFQEMESFRRGDESSENLTLDWLLAQNPNYTAAAVGNPAEFPSTQPILYRADRLTVLDQGWFFFADTPDVIYARTFNGSFPAFASWAQFQDIADGTVFRVINLHTDYGSRSNRLQSVALVADRIAPWITAGETVVLTGDLNARADSQTVGILENTGLIFTTVNGATYHFNRGLNLFGAIDHIAYIGALQPIGPPVVLRDKFSEEWPTDHYPVIADFIRN